MNSFLKGVLVGVGAIIVLIAIILPIVLAANFSFMWFLLYLIEFPVGIGFVGMILEW